MQARFPREKEESPAKGSCIMPQVTGHNSCISSLQTVWSEDASRPDPSGNLEMRSEAISQGKLWEKQSSRSEAIEALCFEIAARGEANYVENFLLEDDRLPWIRAPTVSSLNTFQSCSSLSPHWFCKTLSRQSMLYMCALCLQIMTWFQIFCPDGANVHICAPWGRISKVYCIALIHVAWRFIWHELISVFAHHLFQSQLSQPRSLPQRGVRHHPVHWHL